MYSGFWDAAVAHDGLGLCPKCHKVVLKHTVVTGTCDKCFVDMMETVLRVEHGVYR